MRNRDGFTLVEVMVAGSLSTILAGAFFSLMYFTTTRMQNSVEDYKMAQDYEIILEEIQRIVRGGYYIKSFESPSDPTNATHPASWERTGPMHTILACDSSGLPIEGFGFRLLSGTPNVGYLEFFKNGAWSEFRISNRRIHLNHGPATILPGRRGASFNLQLVDYQDDRIVRRLYSTKEVIRCRNRRP